MSLCPICGRDHDLNVACTDKTGQVFRDNEGERLSSKEEIKKAEENKFMLRFLLVLLAVALIFLIFSFF
jgi:hypothetical protein